jgi:acyl-CoA synthetase (AMP-forming)/AMP-acid ligase II
MNIGSLLPRHARYRGDYTALVVGSQRLTYRQLNALVNRLAHALLGAGLKKGDKFATVLPNCLELMTAYWAAAKTGLVIVPLSPLLQDTGLATLLRDSDTGLVLGDAAFADTFDRIRGDLGAIPEDGYVLVGDGSNRRGYRPYADFLAGASAENPAGPEISDDDTYNIMYSSGTTGLPKGIVHTHYVRAMYCMLFAQAWRMTPESVVLHAGSIVFNGAMIDLMPWMFVGGTYVLHESFNAERVIEDIEEEKVTHCIMVPAQIIAVLNSPAFDPQKFESLEMLQNLGAPLLLEHKRKEGSVGGCSPFFEIKILKENGEECAPGEVGEIVGRGPILMPGYYKRPELTRETIVDGWLHSGDAGYLDNDGYLFLVDRIKDMIISGGVNVYPKDIEEVMSEHPAVREVAVFGATDPKWGEVPIAAVTLKEGHSVSTDTLVGWTNDRVGAKFQRIRGVVFYDEFPRNVAGKTLKREMREAYEKP